jgi:hypothetical protein
MSMSMSFFIFVKKFINETMETKLPNDGLDNITMKVGINKRGKKAEVL